MSKHFLSVSIVLLSIAIFFLAFQLGKSNNLSLEPKDPIYNVKKLENGLLTAKEVAAYLSMDVEKFNKLIKNQNFERAGYSSFDTYRFIPYIQLNGEKYFTKKQVDEWINYNITTWGNIDF
ncbi:helix-turn-helix domain-containing protein [Psychrobacillus sp. L3]|uniref:helix-turn-helix domain-containing protein n=1 Tax=Psychrobacillus sp. L3 TaxID=3236891 RepID=UPI0036F421E5